MKQKYKNKLGWHKLGVVGVDSAQLLIIDPCYLDDWQIEEYDEGKKPKNKLSYNAVCQSRGQLKYPKGRAGLGVRTLTGYGDGLYEVWERLVDCGDMGIRTAEIKIIFIKDNLK